MDGAVDRWTTGYQPGVSRPEARIRPGYTGASGSRLSRYVLLTRRFRLARSAGFEPTTF